MLSGEKGHLSGSREDMGGGIGKVTRISWVGVGGGVAVKLAVAVEDSGDGEKVVAREGAQAGIRMSSVKNIKRVCFMDAG
jgi:hypothetical protein